MGVGGHGIGLRPRDRWRRRGRVKRTSGRSDIRLLSSKITCGQFLSDFLSKRLNEFCMYEKHLFPQKQSSRFESKTNLVELFCRQHNWHGFSENCEFVNTSSVGWNANDEGRQVNLG